MATVTSEVQELRSNLRNLRETIERKDARIRILEKRLVEYEDENRQLRIKLNKFQDGKTFLIKRNQSLEK